MTRMRLNLLAFAIATAAVAAETEYHKYIVVGAGPGGLQIGHYLESAGRDYVILEQSSVAASFFVKYPRWRQLISINKPNTGRADSFEFNSRHDWNSLLTEPSHAQLADVAIPCPSGAASTNAAPDTAVLCRSASWSASDATRTLNTVDERLMFKNYTDVYYPEADRLAWFLQGYANGTLGLAALGESSPPVPRWNASAWGPLGRPGLNIRYNSRVQSVDRPAGYVSRPSPVQQPAAPVATAGADTSDSANTVAGTGALPVHAAAMQDPWLRLREVALNEPRFVLTVSQSPGRHAEGAEGAGAAEGSEETVTYSCTYLIWAAGLQTPVKPHGVNTGWAIQQGLVHTYASAPADRDLYRNKSVLLLGRGNAAFEFANHVLPVAAYVHLLGQRRKRVSQSIETHYPGDVRHVHSALLETYLLKSMDGMAEIFMETLRFERSSSEDESYGVVPGTHGRPMSVSGGRVNKTLVVDTNGGGGCGTDWHGRSAHRCLFRRSYDYVIACPGWKMDASPAAGGSTGIWSSRTRPALFSNGKHPAISPRYESISTPGLFFAGNLAHAHDFKKSSGGFIHGFRYTARALHRELEEEELEASVAAAARGVALPSASTTTSTAGGTRVEVSATGAPAASGGSSLACTVPGLLSSSDQVLPSLPSLACPAPTPGTGTGPLTATGASPQAVHVGAGTAWPRRLHAGLRDMTEALLRRINHGAGPYQMFGGIVDVLALPPFPVAALTAAGLHAQAWTPHAPSAGKKDAPQAHTAFAGCGVLAPFVELSSFLPSALQRRAAGTGSGSGAGNGNGTESSAPPTSGSTGMLRWALPDDPSSVPSYPSAPGVGPSPRSETRTRSDALLDAAMTGWLLEEVPSRLAEHKAAAWAAQLVDALALVAQQRGGNGSEPLGPFSLLRDVQGQGRVVSGLQQKIGAQSAIAAEYITLSLEFGNSAGPLPGDLQRREAEASAARRAADVGGGAAGQAGAGQRKQHMSVAEQVRARSELKRDPYSLLRANVGASNPEDAHFLHPVLRYFHSGLAPQHSAAKHGHWMQGVSDPSPGYPGSSLGSPGPLPVAELHLLEDFWTDWSSHTLHHLPLARFLQEVACRRVQAAQRVQEAAETPLDPMQMMRLQQAQAGAGGAEVSQLGPWLVPASGGPVTAAQQGKVAAAGAAAGGAAGSKLVFRSDTSLTAGSRKLSAAAAAAHSTSVPAVTAPWSTSGGVVAGQMRGVPPGPMALQMAQGANAQLLVQSAVALKKAWMTDRQHSKHASLFDTVADHADVVLAYRGHVIQGGDAWFHRLSYQALDELLWLGPHMFVVHWLDADPRPISPIEARWTKALSMELDARAPAAASSASSSPSGAAAATVDPAVAQYFDAPAVRESLVDYYAGTKEGIAAISSLLSSNSSMDWVEAARHALNKVHPPRTAQQQQDMEATQAQWLQHWRKATGPDGPLYGLAVLVVPCRSGVDRWWANSMHRHRPLYSPVPPDRHCGSDVAFLFKEGVQVHEPYKELPGLQNAGGARYLPVAGEASVDRLGEALRPLLLKTMPNVLQG